MLKTYDKTINVEIAEKNQQSEEINKTEKDKEKEKDKQETISNPEDIKTEKQVTVEPPATETERDITDKTKLDSLAAHAGWDPDIKKKIPKGWQLITV